MIPSTTGESHPSKYIVGDTGKLGLCVKNVVENEKISPLSVIFHSILFTVIDTDTVTLQPLQGYCEKVGIRTRDPLPRSHMHHQLATVNVVFNPRLVRCQVFFHVKVMSAVKILCLNVQDALYRY